MTTHHPRKFPVVLVTGTPGCGKTLHSQVLAADSDVRMTHLNIGDIVKQHGFHNGFDDEWKSYIVDEDRLLDYLEDVINPTDGPAETGECADAGGGPMLQVENRGMQGREHDRGALGGLRTLSGRL